MQNRSVPGRQALRPDEAGATKERGAATSLDTTDEYALMLAAPSRRQPQAPPGPGKRTQPGASHDRATAHAAKAGHRVPPQ